jgi:hypothetical protein
MVEGTTRSLVSGKSCRSIKSVNTHCKVVRVHFLVIGLLDAIRIHHHYAFAIWGGLFLGYSAMFPY